MRCSNNLVGVFNFIIFLLSIPILIGGIWLSRHGSSQCEKFFDKPVIVLGFFLMLVSLAGFIGSCCRVNWLLWVYLFVMFFVIVALSCFTIFAFIVTNKGAGEALGGKGYKEYRLDNYSNWLQKRVDDTKNWNRIKSCLIDTKVCQSLEKENSTSATQFFLKNLNSIQSGCCKPSNDCNFVYVSPTQWTKTDNTSTTNPDCVAWSNDADKLCYNCSSCKAGFLQNIKSDWKKVAAINIVFLLIVIIVYSIGCRVFRNNRGENYNYGWKPYR